MSAAAQFHDEEILGKAYDSRLMKRLLKYTRSYRWIIVAAIVILLLTAVLQTALAFVTKTGIDEHIVPKNTDGFGMVALTYLAIILLLLALSYGQIYLTMWLGQRIQHDIRMQIFRHLQKLDLSFYDKNPVGRMVTRVTNDVNSMEMFITHGVPMTMWK